MKPGALFLWRQWFSAAIGALACLGMVQLARAELAYQIVWKPNTAGMGVFSGLVQARNGMFYGTSGAYLGRGGTLFQLTSAGYMQVIVNFTGANGLDPEGPLLLANDGNLYGTTCAGGSNDLGTIFRFSTTSGLWVLHSFETNEVGYPRFNLMQAANGLLYGVTTGSWGHRFPTIYQATTNGDVTVLTNFNTHGLVPNDGLVEGPDGWLYGTTSYPNSFEANYLGSIYKVSTNGDFKTLVLFMSSGPYYSPTNCPLAGLALGADGYLYGTLTPPSSYPSRQNGSIFRMTTQGTMTTVSTFDGTNGSYPATRLLLASDGTFYGMTRTTVFRGTPSEESTAIAHFYGTNGSGVTFLEGAPPLTESREGCIYGTSFAQVSFPPTNTPIAFRLVPIPVITMTRQPPSRVTLTWNSFTNGLYQVWYKTNLLATNWTSVFPPVGATGPTCSYSEYTAYVDQRYYKVVLWP